ncbi:hypothetical protein TeGR_g7818 [Tetraparma gracilis]|uniref:ABC transporter domain-containing protein n=1 Tax=Tetraparma gracilis TaxID=2962635 RepID=A0ABQ6N9G3_9STRA|nr:hypothetical protein TeGR_g7818 [Tetraparma gracilis]
MINYPNTLVVVSHDRGFLDEVCSDVIEFKDKLLNYFRGNYTTYVKTSSDAFINQKRMYEAYKEKRDKMQQFVDKFRASASRAALCQSRMKAIEKMDAEAPDDVVVEPVWRFSIENPEPLGRPIISINDIFFDYKSAIDAGKQKDDYLLQDVNFGVDLSSKIGILGANGAGKSTLLNVMLGQLEPLKGTVVRNGRLRIAHFTQHSGDKFDIQLGAVENMLIMFERATDQEMRTHLGKFGITGNDALKPMMMLSGGQKSRVAFSALAYQRPHVIVLDEPTNHLDMETTDALVDAISSFKGGVICVSHDQYFISSCCSELYVVGGGKATRFRGGFDEYKAKTLKETEARVKESVKSLSAMNSNAS